MNTTNTIGSRLQFDEEGFQLFESVPHPGPASGHIHRDVEISVFENGSVTMLYAGRVMTVPPGRLIVHWGIIPHQMLEREPSALVAGVHVPLAWFLQWKLPHAFVSRILNLEIIVDTPHQRPYSDLELLRDWGHLARKGESQGREIVLLEIHSRLWRMALDWDQMPSAEEETRQTLTPGAFFRAAEYVAEHYLKPIRIPEIAKAAGVSRTHIMRLFRQVTGWSINEYITHLRLSHAQRLLMTTDMKVLDIIYDSGFNSLNRFYAIFRQKTGSTPRHFRSAALTHATKQKDEGHE